MLVPAFIDFRLLPAKQQQQQQQLICTADKLLTISLGLFCLTLIPLANLANLPNLVARFDFVIAR